MHSIQTKKLEKEFKHFARSKLPKTVYQRRCDVLSDSCCGGKGKTCASEDAPESWEEVIQSFCDQQDYEKDELPSQVNNWKSDLEERLPA